MAANSIAAVTAVPTTPPTERENDIVAVDAPNRAFPPAHCANVWAAGIVVPRPKPNSTDAATIAAGP
jgi:hypothetical protein